MNESASSLVELTTGLGSLGGDEEEANVDFEEFLFQKKRDREDFWVGRERVEWACCCEKIEGGWRVLLSASESALVLERAWDLLERDGNLRLLVLLAAIEG